MAEAAFKATTKATAEESASAQVAARSKGSKGNEPFFVVRNGAAAKAFYRTRLIQMLQSSSDATGADELSKDQANLVDQIHMLMQADNGMQQMLGCLVLGPIVTREPYDTQINKTRRVLYIYIKSAVRRQGHASKLLHTAQWSLAHGLSLHISQASPMTFGTLLFFATMDFTIATSARSLTGAQIGSKTPWIRMHCEWARQLPLDHNPPSQSVINRKRKQIWSKTTDASVFLSSFVSDPRTIQSTESSNAELRRQFNHNVGTLNGLCFHYRHKGCMYVGEAFAYASLRLMHRGFELTRQRLLSMDEAPLPQCTERDRSERSAAGRSINASAWDAWS